ncbi:PREDICTED: proline-rich protein PRCC [Rhagoletis zephyria]|uniref:proline-rich protein PRCC n=1 Tax=Rhagoletis zephyria TaxID=28612 RepID=UPI000811691F|nr:PREDICTED: proline-rich protein PRCC [Rhagoletis zephyria]
MSLVAYAASSDEDSEYSEDDTLTSNAKAREGTAPGSNGTNEKIANGTISDDEDDYAPTEFTALPNPAKISHGLSLPKPKNINNSKIEDEELEELAPKFSKLPLPKNKVDSSVIIEEDDEFLHKKASQPVEEVKPKPVLIAPNKGPVRITIPSLKEFNDVDQDMTGKSKIKSLPKGQKKCSLLNMLPQAKSEQNFSKATTANKPDSGTNNKANEMPKPTAVNPFIPDTVKNRRPAHNTECVDGMKRITKKSAAKPKITLVECSDSDENSDEGGDFFSLKSEDKLPEVSMNEINAIVAQRAAKMVNAATEFLNKAAEQEKAQVETMEIDYEQLSAEHNHNKAILDQTAIQALAGSTAKRRRKEENIQVVDISSAEVLPSREEWMRTALASSTAYQPTGMLVDEEPAAGTRRKHQITYLAHKAKANEAELQAMWSANRQTRRATQSKYGF